MLHDRAKCPSCGTIPEEWVTAAGRDVIPPPFEPDTHECVGCRDRASFEKAMFDEDGTPPGISIVLKRSDRSEYPRERWVGPSVLDEE